MLAASQESNIPEHIWLHNTYNESWQSRGTNLEHSVPLSEALMRLSKGEGQILNIVCPSRGLGRRNFARGAICEFDLEWSNLGCTYRSNT